MTPTPSQPSAPQPKARVMTAMVDPHFRVLEVGESGLKMRSANDTIPDYHPVAVLPAATRKQAQQLCRFHNLSREHKVNAIKLVVPIYLWGRVVPRILNLIEGTK